MIVFQKSADFSDFMALMHLQEAAGHGSTISLTVLGWPEEMFHV